MGAAQVRGPSFLCPHRGRGSWSRGTGFHLQHSVVRVSWVNRGHISTIKPHQIRPSAERVQWTGAQTVNLFAISTLGLSSYSRNAGFVPGDANGSWEPYQLAVDRGRSMQIDAMDNEESLGMMVGNLLGQFERVDVAPEVDALNLRAA